MDLWDALTSGASAGHGTLHCWEGDGFSSTPWSQVSREALDSTRGLRGAGVEPGAVVATILTNTPATVRGILGVWMAGGVLASLPVPARGMTAASYLGQIERICERIEPQVTLLDDNVLGMLPEELRERFRARSWSSVAGSGAIPPSPPGAESPAFIQFSSGSTSEPKGCVLRTRAIGEQLEMIMAMLQAVPGEETAVSWLPLSHDMGIFGNLLTPWAFDEDLVLSTPERFMMSPRTWFADVAESGATVTCGTNGALAMAARSQRGELPRPLRLHTVILGAERLQWPTLSHALEVFGPSGLRDTHLMPAYGLAEAALAVTATPRDEAPRFLAVDGEALGQGEVAVATDPGPGSATMVASGVPCRGVELHGVDSEGLNELEVSSPCLADGYFEDDSQTRERFAEGRLRTRDLAFVRDGWLYPVGRTDDLISIGGRKVYACEIEAGVDALEGVRRGCSTVVETSRNGRQQLTLLMELGDDAAEQIPLVAREAAAVAMRRAAVTIDACVFLPKGALPKTPSGKIQRYRCREMLDRSSFEPIEHVELAEA
ncbi:MAG TPA: AMP-binding protein [Solirubrobacterales bacterium]